VSIWNGSSRNFQAKRLPSVSSRSRRSRCFEPFPRREVRGVFPLLDRKEAYIKARGEGLSYSLQGFDVTLAHKQPVRLLDDRNDPGAAERWSLYPLSPAPGYAAALALEGCCRQLQCWQSQRIF